MSRAKKAKKDVEPPLRQRGNSSVCSTIDRLRKIIEDDNGGELHHFLSTEKGFRTEQFRHATNLSLVHYVAEREFETAEEADEWLSYTLKQKNQHIEKSSCLGGLRPLDCACKWGNIFGVEWLVKHGANVNESIYPEGPTPYSYALRSSVDRMKKMRCLEEHGYILLPADLAFAAEIQFSSSKASDEFFHYFVNEKGLSVNATEEERKTTPLHRACWLGSIFGVKWLLEHKADINSVDEEGTTPFMLACQSSINRLVKVRYLDEKGADCRAKDHEGKTALFYATYPSNYKDDVKDVLQYLVVEKGIHINSVDKKGRTPLLS
ncbi:inversin-B-like isoform X2 [Oscarella lobularis]|uniref:inversin-B-like isoform X2 n=1 Tax=Oscarella lobularis TaxID=121494 RepID=UPI003313968D